MLVFRLFSEITVLSICSYVSERKCAQNFPSLPSLTKALLLSANLTCLWNVIPTGWCTVPATALFLFFFFCISTVVSFWHHPEMTRSIKYQKIVLSFKKGILWIYSSMSVLSSFIQFCMLPLKILEMHYKSYSLISLC